MHPITLPIKELRPALSGLAKIINRHTSLPILTQVRIERDREGWTTLTGTDLDRFATMRFEQPDKGEALALLVPHEELLKLSKTCGKDENLFVEPGEENTAILKFPLADRLGETKVTSLPVAEFPAIPKIKADAIPLPPELRRSIHEAMECASTDSTRYVLNSTFIDTGNPKANYIVGTDGKHLYSANSFALPLKHSLIIPSNKFLGWKEFNLDGEWQLKADEKSVQLNSRRWQFISKQIDANYPDWKVVVPDQRGDQTVITIDPGALDSLIQTIQRMPCHDEGRHSTIGIEWQTGQLRLLGKSHENEPWTRIVIPAVKGKGEDVKILCDRRYLLKALGFGLNTIGLADEMAPLRFSNGGRQMIVMPLRFSAVPASEPTAPPTNPPPPVQVDASTNPPPPADQPQQKPTMQTHTANGQPHPAAINGTTTSAAATTTDKQETKPSLEAALVQVESIKTSFREAINGLTKLGDTIRAAMREQKASEKEVHTVRQTLRSLQGVRI